jgi:hypothetical protein
MVATGATAFGSGSDSGLEGTTYDVPGIFGYLSATYHMQ